MRRILLSASILAAAAVFVVIATGASSSRNQGMTYKIQLDNAFGLVTGAQFKVAGIPAGSIQNISLDQKNLHAVVTVNVTQPGLSAFHTSATCNSQPQSLIGEYFISCEPGTTGKLLKNGATIPVSHTQSTIPADLLLDIMRMPEREGLQMIINGLGAGVAARGESLQAALDRAVPALTQTDNLLNLLADDSHTLQQLTASSDQVVTALARNTSAITRFIQYARNTAVDTATQKVAFQQTWHDLPGFLEQLRPAMAKLGRVATTNLPVATNLHAAAGQLDTLFTNLPAFAHSSLPAFRALGQASVTGKVALQAAKPTISELEAFAKPTPELAKNLSIVLPHIDTQKTATERNARSPGGKGFSGLESLLQFAFNLAGATDYYGPFGHMLAVDAFVSQMCSPYANPASVAAGLKQYGSAYRSCYAWLGKNQPGVNETDPSRPSACVPDSGGAPPGKTGPSSSACKLSSAELASVRRQRSSSSLGSTGKGGSGAGSSASGSSTSSTGSSGSSLSSTLGTIESLLGGSGGGSGSSRGSSSAGSSGGSSNQTQQLLNYLLAP